MPTSGKADQPIILLTGGSGYVGGRLIPLLERQGVNLRCLARNPDKLRSKVQAASEVVQGDVLDPPSLDRALQGVHTAYYLVHLMSGSGRRTSSGRTGRRRRTSPGQQDKPGYDASSTSVVWVTMPTRNSPRISAAAMRSARSCGIPAWRPSNSGRRW